MVLCCLHVSRSLPILSLTAGKLPPVWQRVLGQVLEARRRRGVSPDAPLQRDELTDKQLWQLLRACLNCGSPTHRAADCSWHVAAAHQRMDDLMRQNQRLRQQAAQAAAASAGLGLAATAAATAAPPAAAAPLPAMSQSDMAGPTDMEHDWEWN